MLISDFRSLLKLTFAYICYRRGHNKAYYVKRWITEIAMTIAKRGAEVALDRLYTVAGERMVGLEADKDMGAMTGEDGEPFLYGCGDRGGECVVACAA